MRQLPAEASRSTSLTQLHLRRHQLWKILVQIGQLKELTSLNLSHNRLSQLPTEISRLPQLSILNLDQNPLLDPPTEFGRLRNYRQQMETTAHELTQLIDTANTPIFGVDRDGMINEWNKQMARINGYSKEGVVVRTLSRSILPMSAKNRYNRC